MSDKSITINYTAKTIDGQDKLWTGFGSGMAHGLSAKVGNYTISEFKASEIFVDCVEISKYVAEAEEIRTAYKDSLKGIIAIIDGAKTGKYVAPFKDLPMIEELRHALGEAICRADQEGYERAVKDQQEAIENHKAYVLPSARFADGGYVKCGRIDNDEELRFINDGYCGRVKLGRIDNDEISGVVRPSEVLLAMTDEQFASIMEKVKSEPGGSLEIIDDSPFEPEERARYIAKQMINAALDEHMAKLEGGK